MTGCASKQQSCNGLTRSSRGCLGVPRPASPLVRGKLRREVPVQPVALLHRKVVRADGPASRTEGAEDRDSGDLAPAEQWQVRVDEREHRLDRDAVELRPVRQGLLHSRDLPGNACNELGLVPAGDDQPVRDRAPQPAGPAHLDPR
jgi:hypothetical protein